MARSGSGSTGHPARQGSDSSANAGARAACRSLRGYADRLPHTGRPGYILPRMSPARRDAIRRPCRSVVRGSGFALNRLFKASDIRDPYGNQPSLRRRIPAPRHPADRPTRGAAVRRDPPRGEYPDLLGGHCTRRASVRAIPRDPRYAPSELAGLAGLDPLALICLGLARRRLQPLRLGGQPHRVPLQQPLGRKGRAVAHRTPARSREHLHKRAGRERADAHRGDQKISLCLRFGDSFSDPALCPRGRTDPLVSLHCLGACRSVFGLSDGKPRDEVSGDASASRSTTRDEPRFRRFRGRAEHGAPSQFYPDAERRCGRHRHVGSRAEGG